LRIRKVIAWFPGSETGFGLQARCRAEWVVAKIEFPEGWACVAEPLRALIAEVDRAAHAGVTPSDRSAVSAQWVRVSDAIRATVRSRIADARAAEERATKR
jgi:hypothetical protein